MRYQWRDRDRAAVGGQVRAILAMACEHRIVASAATIRSDSGILPAWTMLGRRHCVLLATLVLCRCFLTEVQGACPSKCNRHGTCGSDNTCTCFPGYTGYDCNSRACPKGAPWVDFATGQDSVRSVPQECSNRGRCNRGNGKCECDAGFAGAACERLQVCRTNCNGHGKCMSMRAMAATKNDYNLLYSATYDTPWDADRIYGCVCDHGYTGADCSLRQCPYGDDPTSTGQVDEVQSVSCLCNGCMGAFTLSFRGETTRPLDGSVDTAATLKAALEELITIRGVSVALNGGTTLCDSDGVSAMVTFGYEHGDVPALVATSSFSGGTSSLTVETDGTQAVYGSTPPLTVRGTKEWLECAGRGTCNTLIGLCACATGFGPSDEMTQGCYCDKVPLDRGKSVRYSGYSCSKTPCPSGDDPWTTNQADEAQTVSCSADGGTFTLSFRGETTLPIPFSASTAAVKLALERLLTITSVGVSALSGTSACSNAGNVMVVTFYSPSGDLPLLSITAAALTHSTATVATGVAQTTQGTKEDAVCNNRGRCDEDTGTCICSLYHASSNALGDFGALDDCGAVDAFMTHGGL
ncbi:hypothetical protein PHYPSEUDO_009748 [Phytophthora pseudosyringae]|uniref:EGF-like domain-containing protein n=1 Tax=Phytophthora pseudosyringae TaxID=221518 RepID=A0A8T1VEX6_9STRA|nr:hypothetical protein PHYPSEUDO_009748 [Phytophthora pseudosyringae]